MPFSVLEFSAKIKNKYPEYADMNDTLLVEKIIAKYPEYKTHVDFQATKDTKQKKSPEKKGFFPKTAEAVKSVLGPEGAIEQAKAGFISGVTLGASEQIVPALRTAKDVAMGRALGTETIGGLFKKHKAETVAEAKRHPVARTVGEIAAFATPGGAPSLLFKGSKKATAKLAPKLVKKAAEKFLPKLGEAAIETGIGMGAIGAAKEIIESGDVKKAAKKGMKEGFVGAVAAPLTIATGTGIGNLYKTSKGVAKETLGKLAKTDSEVLTEFAKRSKKVTEAFGTRPKIADDIVEVTEIMTKKGLPEYQAASKLLPKMGTVKTDKVRSVFQNVIDKGAKSPEQKPMMGKMQEWLDDYIPKGKVSAVEMEEIKQALAKTAKDSFGKPDVAEYFQIIKKGSHTARKVIEDAAEAKGLSAYAVNMKAASNKISSVKKINEILGKEIQDRGIKANRMVETLFHKGVNSKKALGRLTEIDKIYGTKFVDRAKIADIAQKIGPEGTPAWLPNWQTGAMVLPLLVSGGAGVQAYREAKAGKTGRAALLAGIATLSSPKVAAQIFKGGQLPGKLVSAFKSNPAALRAINNNKNYSLALRRAAAMLIEKPVSEGLNLLEDSPVLVDLIDIFDKESKK